MWSQFVADVNENRRVGGGGGRGGGGPVTVINIDGLTLSQL